MERFDLSDAQAQAIVDMRLRALTGLEREKLENEYKELVALHRAVKSHPRRPQGASWRYPQGDSDRIRKIRR